MAYKIYTKRNLADTSRDPDKYVYEQLGYKNNLEDAIKVANEYIQKRFFRKDTQLTKGQGKVVLRALDFCSYGAEINIEEIVIN
jgi:hypothetical protein